MAYLELIPYDRSNGRLRDTYDVLRQRPLPPVYRPTHGGAPGIILAHSRDPEAMRRTFQVSGNLNGQGPLSWHERELVNAITSRLNQCFY